MADLVPVEIQTVSLDFGQEKNESATSFLTIDDLRAKNREKLIENLERLLEEKNASIIKLEQREEALEEKLKKSNEECYILEEKIKQFEEKTCTFEELHRLQVQTFEKTIREFQLENERLCDHIEELSHELREKSAYNLITQEKVLTFDRIVGDIQLWREKLDTYKATIEEREKTIFNLQNEICNLEQQKQVKNHSVDIKDSHASEKIEKFQQIITDREQEIEQLKTTLRRVRDTLKQAQQTRIDDRSPIRAESDASIEVDTLKKKIRSLTEQLTQSQQLLLERDEHIGTLKKVHDKRWLRLKHLQKQYRLLKDEFRLYADDEISQKLIPVDYSYRRAVKKSKIGCSICNDHRWRKANNVQNSNIFKQEDDDKVWNELFKLRRENARLIDENLTSNEKIDSQQVEINEQAIIIGELREELRISMDNDEHVIEQSPPRIVSTRKNDEQMRLIEVLDKKLYELETERTEQILEHERLKTDYGLLLDAKEKLKEQRNQMRSEFKKSKLQILALQDQIRKLKRNVTKKEIQPIVPPKMKRRRNKRKNVSISTTKSCLELLLDQNATLVDDLQTESLVSMRQATRFPNPDDTLTNSSYTRRNSLLSNLSNRPKKKSVPLKRSRPITQNGFSATRIRNNKIQELEHDLKQAQANNKQLHQRLTTFLNRIYHLKSINQKLKDECEILRTSSSTAINSSVQNISQPESNIHLVDHHLYERLKNTSLDAAQQRRLNKTLQIDNESLSKSLQILTEKYAHAERDLASKRALIDNYKLRFTEMENNTNRAMEKNLLESHEERLKNLTESNEKLRISNESYKTRLQAVSKEKHEIEQKHHQIMEEHSKLKSRFEDIQSKLRSNEQQFRQTRLDYDRVNQELVMTRQHSEQQIVALTVKHQDLVAKINIDLERTRHRLVEFEQFIYDLLQELLLRKKNFSENLQRTQEQQKHRESLSMTLPGYDTAMHTASKILNLTQDDLDELMSMTDESFHIKPKTDGSNKDHKLKDKVTKLLATQEHVASKLLKIFSKKLDEIQDIHRDLTMLRNA